MRTIWKGSVVCGLLLGIAALAVGALAVLPQPTQAEQRTARLETVARYGPDLAAYATVRRNDGTYRRMLVSPDALNGLETGEALPEGTRILMETYYRPDQVGTVFHKQKVEGAWHYGSFPASRPNLSVRPQASCLSCHARAAETDFTFTLPSLWAVASGRASSDFGCDRGGRSPCSLRTYLEGAGP